MTFGLLLLSACLSQAQISDAPPGPTPGLTGVGVKLNGALSGGDLGPNYGASIDVRHGFALDGRLGVSLEVGWAHSVATGSFTSGPVPAGLNFRVTENVMPAILAVYFRQMLLSGFYGYVSVGGVGAFLRSSTEAGGGTNIEHGHAFGLDSLAGAELMAGPGSVLLEVGYRYLRTSDTIPGVGNLSGPLLRAGYRFWF